MKPFAAIVDVTLENRLAKWQDFDTLNEAEAHVAFVIGNYPDAFAIPTPIGGTDDWLIDTVLKSVSISILPPTVPLFISKVQFVRALRAIGQWDTVKADLPNIPLAVREDWDFSSRIGRHETIVVTLMANLNIPEAQMDSLFVNGSIL